MKRVSFVAVFIVLLSLPWGGGLSQAADQTINIMCWEGYADQAVIDAFKTLVKDKYKMEVEVKTAYATGQEDFYNAAKDGTADLISPPADTPNPTSWISGRVGGKLAGGGGWW